MAPRACARVYARVLVPPNLYIHTYSRGLPIAAWRLVLQQQQHYQHTLYLSRSLYIAYTYVYVINNSQYSRPRFPQQNIYNIQKVKRRCDPRLDSSIMHSI